MIGVNEYKKSNTLMAVKQNKWIVTVVPQDSPIIVNKMTVDGEQFEDVLWEVQTKIKVRYL